jgi:hypothetical protein
MGKKRQKEVKLEMTIPLESVCLSAGLPATSESQRLWPNARRTVNERSHTSRPAETTSDVILGSLALRGNDVGAVEAAPRLLAPLLQRRCHRGGLVKVIAQRSTTREQQPQKLRTRSAAHRACPWGAEDRANQVTQEDNKVGRIRLGDSRQGNDGETYLFPPCPNGDRVSCVSCRQARQTGIGVIPMRGNQISVGKVE